MCVGHGVVPPEDPGGGDVRDQHVDAVVLMSNQDADNSRGAEQPAEPVVPPHPPGGVCGNTNQLRMGVCLCVSVCVVLLSMYLCLYTCCAHLFTSFCVSL